MLQSTSTINKIEITFKCILFQKVAEFSALHIKKSHGWNSEYTPEFNRISGQVLVYSCLPIDVGAWIQHDWDYKSTAKTTLPLPRFHPETITLVQISKLINDVSTGYNKLLHGLSYAGWHTPTRVQWKMTIGFNSRHSTHIYLSTKYDHQISSHQIPSCFLFNFVQVRRLFKGHSSRSIEQHRLLFQMFHKFL